MYYRPWPIVNFCYNPAQGLDFSPQTCHTTYMKNEIAFTAYNHPFSYEPKDYIGTLDWFNIAQCARQRMIETSPNIHVWRGNRRSFYSALQLMGIHNVGLMD
jgi:hypothetical protein